MQLEEKMGSSSLWLFYVGYSQWSPITAEIANMWCSELEMILSIGILSRHEEDTCSPGSAKPLLLIEYQWDSVLTVKKCKIKERFF